MSKSTKIQPQVLIIGGLVAAGLLILAAGYLLLVSPESSKISGLSNQLDDAQTQVIVAQGAQAKPVPFKASDLFRLARAMPSGTDMPGILLALSHVARQSSVTVTSVHPSPPVTLGLGYSAIPISITITGRYTAISRFEHLLRTTVRLRTINDLVVAGRLFDSDSISLGPLSGASTATGSGTTAATGKAAVTPPDELTASISLDAFTFGGPPPVSATAGSAVSTSTSTSGSGT